MRVLPILFNADMVRAILDGRKTVTRRVIKPQPEVFGKAYIYKGAIRSGAGMAKGSMYQPGDILYVRETWLRIESCIYCMCYSEPPEQDGCYLYRATHGDAKGLRWRPSIHMPKAAARIWLKVTDVRVERLQDMYVDDAIKEGAWGNGKPNIPFSILGEKYPNACNATASFAHLWDSTIKKTGLNRYGWDANPWVWVIEFERCEKPEPCIIAGVEPAESKRPCIGYSRSDTDDEPCEMCKACTRRDGYDSEEN